MSSDLEQLQNAIRQAIRRHALESDVTLAEAIGVLEIEKQTLLNLAAQDIEEED